MTSEDELDIIDIALMAGDAVLAAGSEILDYGARFAKIAKHTSMLSGHQWIEELLAGHDERFYNELGLHKHVFRQLLSVLDRDAGLCGSRHVSASEHLCIFLHYARRSLSNRALQERFQRSGDTITKYGLIIGYIAYETITRSDVFTACWTR